MIQNEQRELWRKLGRLMTSSLERTFETVWRQLGGGSYQKEYRFAYVAIGSPEKGIRAKLKDVGLRDWRFDCAFPAVKIAIELEGGTWVNGAHNRGKHFASDCEKYNAANLLGWRVFRFTSDMIASDPVKHLQPLVFITVKIEDLTNLQLSYLEGALSLYLESDISAVVLPMVQQFYNQVILEMDGA